MDTYIISFFLVFTAGILETVSSFQCLSDNRGVDWFVVIKPPRCVKQNGKKTRGRSGEEYFTINSGSNAWSSERNQLDDRNSPITQTLSQVNNIEANEMAMMYNDAFAGHAYGHAKGTIAFNSWRGFWLIHSAPMFPDRNSGLTYPARAKPFGQIFMCITMRSADFDKLMEHIWHLKPFVYRNSVGNNFNKKDDVKLNRIMQRKNDVGQNRTTYEWDFAGFKAFAKPRKHHIDIYEHVATKLGNNLKVQTWRTGSGRPLPSTRKVKNIEGMSIGGNQWKYTQDHAKWAITQNRAYFCIGDLNRMNSQTKRGGGAVCLRNNNIANRFNSAALLGNVAEVCPKKRKKPDSSRSRSQSPDKSRSRSRSPSRKPSQPRGSSPKGRQNQRQRSGSRGRSRSPKKSTSNRRPGKVRKPHSKKPTRKPRPRSGKIRGMKQPRKPKSRPSRPKGKPKRHNRPRHGPKRKTNRPRPRKSHKKPISRPRSRPQSVRKPKGKAKPRSGSRNRPRSPRRRTTTPKRKPAKPRRQTKKPKFPRLPKLPKLPRIKKLPKLPKKVPKLPKLKLPFFRRG